MLQLLGLRDILAAIAGGAIVVLATMIYLPFRDASVASEARREYVAISELEAARARVETAEALRRAAEQRAIELEQARAAYAAALDQARQELQIANLTQQDLEDALEEIRRARPADRSVPTVRDLVGDRLHH